MLIGRLTMKRLLICSAFVLISAVLSFGQCVGNCTSVTAALTDGGGQQWPNATVTILLVRPFGNPAPVLNNGVPVNSPVNVLSTNGSGVFTISLDDTTKLTPSGAQWQFTMCPNASVTNCSQITTGVFGASQSLTSLLSGALITPIVNATPALTRVYNNNEANGSQGTLIWNTISNLIYGCNAIPCVSNWVQIGSGAGSNFSSPPPLGNILPNSVAASTLTATGLSTLNTINAACIGTNGNIDALCAGIGVTGDVKIQSIIANATYCPPFVGCIINLTNMVSTNDLLWLTNPAAGHNRGVQFLLGNHTYVACQPIIDGQSGYVWTGPDAPSGVNFPITQITGGAIIKAGTAGDGCPGNFPNSGPGSVTTTWPHGPHAAGIYTSLYNASGNPDTSGGGPSAINTPDSFGGYLQNITLDCANIVTCSFDFFSSSQEERAGMFGVALRGANNGCGFWDRSYQPGPPSPGGSGPVHFEVHNIQCTPGSQVTNCGVGSTSCTFYAFAYEGNTTYISFSGQSGCSATATPNQTGTPQAYVIVSTGSAGTPVITNQGNCTVPPTGCTLNTASGGTGAVCQIDLVSGSHLTGMSFPTPGTGYSNAQVPGGGPRFSNITVIGNTSGTLIQNNDAFAIEGDYNTYLGQIHTQNVHGAVYHHGLGNAPYWNGVVEGINATNGGDTGSTVLRCGVGMVDTNCSGIALQRLISVGNVLTDDVNNVILKTSDTPSHAFIPFYPTSAGGTVTNIATGAGLTGGPITGTGTISLLTALPNGETATTQGTGDTSLDVATDAFVHNVVSGISTTFPSVVYFTQSASSSASIAATNMTTSSGGTYRLNFYVTNTGSGVSCVGTTGLTLAVNYNDPNTGTLATTSLAGIVLASSGNGAAGPVGLVTPVVFTAKSGTLIQYQATYSVGSSCSPGPTYTVQPILEQLK